MSNVYSKLQKCRVELQKINLRKSGRNTFSGYDYFQLSDFLHEINELFDQHQLFSQIGFTDELATLTIINTEKIDEKIIFTSPMKDVTLKGAHAIQNLGAVQTYQRRYLYLMALEIVEDDTLDATQGKEKAVQDTINRANQNVNNSTKPISDGQKKLITDKLTALAKKHNLSLETLMQKKNIGDLNAFTSGQASSLINSIKEWETK